MLDEYTVSSSSLVGERKVWTLRDRSQVADSVCIFLDAELYLDRVKALDMIVQLQTEDLIRPMTFAFLSYGSAAERHRDFTCSELFTEFLISEFLPWFENNIHVYHCVYVCGLSLSGLAALFALSKHPTRFAGILSQSPSAWWNGEWLATHCHFAGVESTPVWLSVGKEEVEQNVTHGPTGLYQGVSQLESCRRLNLSLESAGVMVHYSEFPGGHDPACWASELPTALMWLLA